MTTLPPPLPDPALNAAQDAAAAATQAHDTAAAAHRDAAVALAAAQRRVDTLTERRDAAETRIAVLLPDRTAGAARDIAADLAYLDEAEASRQVLLDAEHAARAGAGRRRDGQQRARAALEAVTLDLATARNQLHTLLGTLAELDPPHVDAGDLGAAWSVLATWATEQTAAAADTAAQAAADAAAAAAAFTRRRRGPNRRRGTAHQTQARYNRGGPRRHSRRPPGDHPDQPDRRAGDPAVQCAARRRARHPAGRVRPPRSRGHRRPHRRGRGPR